MNDAEILALIIIGIVSLLLWDIRRASRRLDEEQNKREVAERERKNREFDRMIEEHRRLLAQAKPPWKYVPPGKR